MLYIQIQSNRGLCFRNYWSFLFSERLISHVNSLVIDQPLLCHVEYVNSTFHILSFDTGLLYSE